MTTTTTVKPSAPARSSLRSRRPRDAGHGLQRWGPERLAAHRQRQATAAAVLDDERGGSVAYIPLILMMVASMALGVIIWVLATGGGVAPANTGGLIDTGTAPDMAIPAEFIPADFIPADDVRATLDVVDSALSAARATGVESESVTTLGLYSEILRFVLGDAQAGTAAGRLFVPSLGADAALRGTTITGAPGGPLTLGAVFDEAPALAVAVLAEAGQ